MGGVGGPELQVCIGPQHPRRRRAPPLHRTAMIAIASAVSRLDLACGKAASHLGLLPSYSFPKCTITMYYVWSLGYVLWDTFFGHPEFTQDPRKS